MGSCGAQKVSISQSCSEAHWRGQGCANWLTYSTWAQSASPNQQLQCHGAPKETPKLLIYFIRWNHANGPHSWCFPAFPPLHLLVEETDDVGALLVYFFPEFLSRLILSEIIPCSPQYGATLRYTRKRLSGAHHIYSGPTSHITRLCFNERHCFKFHSNHRNIYSWIVTPLIVLCWFKCRSIWGLMTQQGRLRALSSWPNSTESWLG